MPTPKASFAWRTGVGARVSGSWGPYLVSNTNEHAVRDRVATRIDECRQRAGQDSALGQPSSTVRYYAEDCRARKGEPHDRDCIRLQRLRKRVDVCLYW